jgi:hypothetical protein
MRAVRVEFVPAEKKREEVPVVVGGVYRFIEDSLTNSLSLRVLVKSIGYSDWEYLMFDIEGGTIRNNFKNITSLKSRLGEGDYVYIPDAVLHIPKEDT